MPALRKRPEQLRSEAITKAFRHALIEKGWTQAHLAKLLGVNPPCVCRIISSPMTKQLETVLKVADKLGVDLLGGINQPPAQA